MEETAETCSICLEPMKLRCGKSLFTAECTHVFHTSCIFKYARKHCPICRATWVDIPWANTPPSPSGAQTFRAQSIDLSDDEDYPVYRVRRALFAPILRRNHVALLGLKEGIQMWKSYDVIKVRCTCKKFMHRSNGSFEGNVLNFEFQDRQGTKMEGVLYCEVADAFCDRLEYGHVYSVTRFRVQLVTKPDFLSLPNKNQITFHLDTELTEISEPDFPPTKFDFLQISEIKSRLRKRDHSGAEMFRFVDLVGLVTNVRRSSCSAIDHSGESIEVFYGEEHNVVAGAVLVFRKLSPRGGGLRTTHLSIVLNEPDIPEVHAIKSWFLDS